MMQPGGGREHPRHNPQSATCSRLQVMSDPAGSLLVAEWCKGCKTMKATVTGGLLHVEPIGIFGSGGRDRTYDQLINSQLLYR